MSKYCHCKPGAWLAVLALLLSLSLARASDPSVPVTVTADFLVPSNGPDDILFGGDYSQGSVTFNIFSNSTPALDPTADISVDEGSLATFKVVGHDPDGQILTYSLLGTLPVGAAINPAT